MVTTQTQRRFNDEDTDVLDDFDPAFFPKRVYKDGRGPNVRLMLTDGAPDRTPPTKQALFDARNHQPRSADLSDVAAYEAWRDGYLRDAWRTMGGGTGGAPHTTAPEAEEPDGESPRDAYIRRLQNAWRTPPGSPDHSDSDNPIEALNRRWRSPGATPGPGQTNDAAAPKMSIADAEREAAKAHAEYEHDLRNAYKTPIGNGWRR